MEAEAQKLLEGLIEWLALKPTDPQEWPILKGQLTNALLAAKAEGREQGYWDGFAAGQKETKCHDPKLCEDCKALVAKGRVEGQHNVCEELFMNAGPLESERIIKEFIPCLQPPPPAVPEWIEAAERHLKHPDEWSECLLGAPEMVLETAVAMLQSDLQKAIDAAKHAPKAVEGAISNEQKSSGKVPLYDGTKPIIDQYYANLRRRMGRLFLAATDLKDELGLYLAGNRKSPPTSELLALSTALNEWEKNNVKS